MVPHPGQGLFEAGQIFRGRQRLGMEGPQVIAVGDGNVMRLVQIFFDRPPSAFVGQDHPDRPVRLVILNLPILRGEMDYHFENTVTHCSTHPESVHFPAPGSE